MTRRPDGSLEQDVLAVLWQADTSMSPAQVNERLGGDLAYTTVATVLTRLHGKGLLDRQPAGRAYAYRPAIGEPDLAARRIGEVLACAHDRPGVLARFVGGLSARDAKLLRRLLDEERGR